MHNLESLIHTGDVSFCQDGAAAIAAAVAAGFEQDATHQQYLPSVWRRRSRRHTP